MNDELEVFERKSTRPKRQSPISKKSERCRKPGPLILAAIGDHSTLNLPLAPTDTYARRAVLSAYAINPGGTFIYEADNRATFRLQRPGVAVMVILACIPK